MISSFGVLSPIVLAILPEICYYHLREKVIPVDKDEKRRRMLEGIRKFRLIDDTFMNVCFNDSPECTQLVLRIILGRDDIVVTSVKAQTRMKNLNGRDVCLDILAEDGENRTINIEIQRSDAGAGMRRARYHSSILDAHLLLPGSDFDDLPETYVIFITENDVLGLGAPLYTIDRQITNFGKPFDDGEHIIYVNGANRDGATALGRLMQDFFCADPDKMHYKPLADRTRHFKEHGQEDVGMCKIMEDFGKEERHDANMETAARLLAMGLTVDQVAVGTGLTIEEVKALSESKSA